MDFSKFLIATDLDGTFFADGSKTVQRNLDAIARFRAGGGMFTFSTGRVQLNVHKRIPHPEVLLSAPAVMCNGAYLYDFSTHTALFEEFMPENLTREVLAFARERFPDVAFRVAAPDTLRIESVTDPYIAKDVQGYLPESVRISPADTWQMDDWYKIVFRADAARNAEVRRMLEARFAGALTVTPSTPTIMEVQCPATNKAAGIEKLRRYLGESTRTVITCGDFENDIPMHRAADVAIAPANALPEVKALCDLMLCSNNEGVIADVIEAIENGRITPKTV